MVFLREEIFRLSDTPVSLLSLLIFGFGVLLSVVIGRIASRVVRVFFEKRPSTPAGIAYATSRMVQYGVVTTGIFVCLDTLGVDLNTLAALGAMVSVGVGFGLQTITHNFISGLILLIERPIQKGDYVVVGDVVGRVTEIELRATKVVSRDGVAIIVPNSEFISARVINQSHPTTLKRVRVSVGVAYGSDPKVVREVLQEIALAHEKVLRDPPPVVFFKNFGDSTLDFDLAVWLENPDLEPLVSSDLRFSIHHVFRERRIEIPFPQREVRLVS
jgi:small-conductance mechanosensitive channel